MIKNDAGQVAFWYFNTHQKLVRLGNGHAYVFVPKNHVCLAWIDDADIPAVLEVYEGCHCPNKTRKPAFRYASQQEVNIWTGTGSRHP
jgi:hypothetical protein